MSALKYATPKHAWVWVCYMHRLALERDVERPLVFSAVQSSPHTLRLRLFQGRTFLEKETHDAALQSYLTLSYETQIKFKPPVVEVYRRAGFGLAYTERKSNSFDLVLEQIHTFIGRDRTQLQISDPGIDDIQCKAIKLYLEPIRCIRTAIVEPEAILLTK